MLEKDVAVSEIAARAKCSRMSVYRCRNEKKSQETGAVQESSHDTNDQSQAAASTGTDS
jgi:hypothetical protein